ncbi:MAG: DUF4402 domain-containing protein [Candidatus Lambdaproteobacteria bacterium]|nr:DUF4402 domain-containing protein [Candidatus Lambdaproteobacteria bacterium]
MARGTVKMMAAIAVAVAAIVVSANTHAQALVITKIRDLNFGLCDQGVAATYVVAAANNPGTGACIGATSGRFRVTGAPRQTVTISLIPVPVTITNGTDALSVTENASPTGTRRLNASGNLIIHVGGTVTLTTASLSQDVDLIGTATLRVQ